jgi:excisionase family DNA binding protein
MEPFYYISREEASKRTSLSTRQIDRYIRDGRIKAFKPRNGRRVLIDPKSITEENLKTAKPKYINFDELNY